MGVRRRAARPSQRRRWAFFNSLLEGVAEERGDPTHPRESLVELHRLRRPPGGDDATHDRFAEIHLLDRIPAETAGLAASSLERLAFSANLTVRAQIFEKIEAVDRASIDGVECLLDPRDGVTPLRGLGEDGVHRSPSLISPEAREKLRGTAENDACGFVLRS